MFAPNVGIISLNDRHAGIVTWLPLYLWRRRKCEKF